mmetsp:Transcript_26320/g.39018  ORF Transcript_26320/g.39018 Transcript_26320/m.39018 type:complete len:1021 (-) Transcript_26320:176-3238(-)|eukprot:CAMPEP_0185037462 /NCGR_PEP_ID=MMETSP1103-20130426/31943_1 /TAXON_ID=36769 /ORGANISM="Paraphysomonas bandaiensis, Strain Caron Lab Isolate" /LENGTH=1020 /DNA_ID=CAMNT_0027575451 /DNA_START=29 /DNA_END=3091 /DNA_ORIENTATION=+
MPKKANRDAGLSVLADLGIIDDTSDHETTHSKPVAKGKKGKKSKGEIKTMKSSVVDDNESDNEKEMNGKQSAFSLADEHDSESEGQIKGKKGKKGKSTIKNKINVDSDSDDAGRGGKKGKKGKNKKEAIAIPVIEGDSDEEVIETSRNSKKNKKSKNKAVKRAEIIDCHEDDEEEEGSDSEANGPQESSTPIVEDVAEEMAALNVDEDSDEEEQTKTKSKGKLSKAERKKQKSAQKSSTKSVVTESIPPKSDDTQKISNESAVAVEEVHVNITPDEEPAAPPSENPPAATTASAQPEETDSGSKKPKKKEKKNKLLRNLDARKKELEEAEKAAREAEEAAAKEAAKNAPTKTKEKKKSKPVVPDDVDEEAVMRSTMFGDEVANEYGPPPTATVEPEPVAVSGKKLSNKEKKKLEREREAKVREAAYDVALMKASQEGAQFAVSQSAVDENDPQWQNALDISVPSLSISAHNKELFVDAELNIAHGRRYGLVGPNGAGKSTLLKMIASGELKLPPRIDYLYVEQEVLADDTPAVDAVLKADKERWVLLQEEKSIMKQIEESGSAVDEALDARLGEVHQQLAVIGASSAEAKARRILFGLGFTAEMQVRATKFFSGGWRMRISLARALFIEPTLLMLDEPTNHLDLNAVIWLDDYLQRWKKTLLIVSHDQDFLNSVCQEIIHLEDKKLVTYRGNYDNFKEQEATKRKQLQKAWEKQEKRLREMKSKGQTKQNAEKNLLKAKSREPGARSKKQAAAEVASGTGSAETKVELIKRPREYTVKFTFPEVSIISPPILEVRDVNFRYGPNLPWLFRGLNFGLDMHSRVCIVGPNGSGKSTLIKLITEDVRPPEGEVLKNPRLRIGVYNQHFVDRLPMDEDPVTYIRRMFNEETYQSARNILGRYGLEGHAHTIPIRDLSGGQKARVVFVELSLMAPHLLFLDEPTNNLDIESIDALCDALRAYNGGVVLVSHDARLIETTECQLWVVDDQNVEPWDSGFEGYREYLLKQLEEQLATIVPGSGERPK